MSTGRVTRLQFSSISFFTIDIVVGPYIKCESAHTAHSNSDVKLFCMQGLKHPKNVCLLNVWPLGEVHTYIIELLGLEEIDDPPKRSHSNYIKLSSSVHPWNV